MTTTVHEQTQTTTTNARSTQRANDLADRLEYGARALASFASTLTDEEWAVVQNNALSLAEAANLLKIPRQMSTPQEANAKSTPDAPELTPAQIEEKVNKDRAAWNSKADALQEIEPDVVQSSKTNFVGFSVKDVQARHL